jgi:formylglycine-generating enzyme required for sulfatase activity
MGGNVSEWCLEWYDAGQTQRLTRGGSWEDHQPQTLASGRRIPLPLSYRTNSVGFRIVLDTRAPASPSGAATKPATPTPPQQAAPAPKPATAAKSDFTNSLGMQFVKISGIKTLFCIHETRYKDYAAYAAATPDVNPRWKNQTLKGIAPKDRTEDHPVVIVSWEDAQAFCAWLSQKEGKRYRLPTDEEWSYAAGIGRDEKRKKGDTPGTLALVPNEYPWGSQWPPSKGCENYGDESYKAAIGEARYLTGYDDGFPTTAPVMSFKPNRYGLYDMGGNVLEWCEDWYNTTQTSRALRGSSWKGGAYDSELRLSHRGQATPDTREDNYGFRIVLETTE